jgi:uncharacterized protein (DUF433 family)
MWQDSLQGVRFSKISEVAEGRCPDHHMTVFERITQNPGVMGGKACIRGCRVTVGMIVGQLGAGCTVEQIVAEYPYLEREDIFEALRYAAWRVQGRETELGSTVDSVPKRVIPQP